MKRIAINGPGRIGRATLKVIPDTPGLEVDGDLVKVMSWYDNEWGISNQMIRQILAL